VSEDKKNGVYNLFLASIVTAIATCIAFTVILIGLGYAISTAFPLAYTLALSVFGAFLFKIYRVTTKATPGNNLPFEERFPDRPKDQRCLILAAPTHGALQDRANYWLSGQYGLVKSTALTATQKGVFMTIFYESNENGELAETNRNEAILESPQMSTAAPLRNFQQ
jgi:hypothetical protein